MINIQALVKRFEGSRGLDGFSLKVHKGALFGLVGPNGAGKTTLIKILATLMRPDEGSATIDGYDVQAYPENVRAIVGYQPDFPGLYPGMRVREYLQFFADAFHLRGAQRERAIAEGLERAGLQNRSDSFLEELSLGLKQRLLLSKTLLHGPKVLLLDEPATGLDPIARIELREQLKQLNAEGVTILVSSHILSDLQDICTHISFIEAGKNASAEGGSSVMHLREPDAAHRYEMAWIGSAVDVGASLAAEEGVNVLSVGEQRAVVSVPEGPVRAATLLRSLIAKGVQVVHFSKSSDSLETRYREMFGGAR